jgi:DNA-binding SARP family transcriptional activator
MMLLPLEQPRMNHPLASHPHEFEARYRAYFFGPFRVLHENQPLGELAWRRSKARELLKLFLLNPGKFFAVDQLSSFLWPSTEHSKSLGSFHVTIHYLRHLLEPNLMPHQRSTFICRNKHNLYYFNPHDMWWSDIFDIQRMHLTAREADKCEDAATAITCYRKLASYYHLGFLPEDIYEDLFIPYRRQHNCAHMQVLERLIQLASQLRLFDEVLTYARQILLIDPYNETAVKEMIHVFLLQGNIAGAIHQLNDFQALLRQDLGIGLSPELLSLRKQILSESA